MSQIKIGVSPLSWMNSDMPELGSHIPVEKCLLDASLIGYQGVELEDPFRKIIDRFPALLKEHNLSLVAGWHSTFLLENGYEKELESLKKHMELLASLGSSIVNLAECSGAVHREERGLSERPKLAEGKLKKLSEGLEKLAEHLEKEGFKSAYHHHMGTVIQDGKDIGFLMDHTETLGLLFDTGHLRYSGEKPLAVLEKHIDRVTHVHCKNVRGSILQEKIQKDHPFFQAIVEGAFTVPGDTSDHHEDYFIDFQAIIHQLKEQGYSGWVVMEAEQDPRVADSYTYAKLGYDTLQSLILNDS